MQSHKKRSALLAVTAAAAVALAVASTAYACTIMNGQTTVTPSTGKAGDTISVGGSGALPTKTYQIRFLNFVSQQDGMLTCMSATGASHPDIQMGTSSYTPDANGNFTAVNQTIPTDVHPKPNLNHGAHPSSSTSSPQGPASICHKTSTESDATNDALVTIT